MHFIKIRVMLKILQILLYRAYELMYHQLYKKKNYSNIHLLTR